MSVMVKICGVTTPEDALFAAQAGADMLGLNFYPKSKRYVTPAQAAGLVAAVRGVLGEAAPLMVGVFVNATVGDISETVHTVGLDAVQLSGDESGAVVRELRGVAFKALRPPSAQMAALDLDEFAPTFPTDPRLPSTLLDASVPGEYGGTGVAAEVELARWVRQSVPRLMLAGGLTPDTVAERVALVQPWGVDVASGVEGEQAGRKDPDKVVRFIRQAKGQ
ncbi:MAG: phosphoribosylanthranilate isomerase [Anaerolineae bacterium]|nr:phosphoribosylanthranilate isomerase [Anaerolineae bacterium]